LEHKNQKTGPSWGRPRGAGIGKIGFSAQRGGRGPIHKGGKGAESQNREKKWEQKVLTGASQGKESSIPKGLHKLGEKSAPSTFSGGASSADPGKALSKKNHRERQQVDSRRKHLPSLVNRKRGSLSLREKKGVIEGKDNEPR